MFQATGEALGESLEADAMANWSVLYDSYFLWQQAINGSISNSAVPFRRIKM